MNNLFNRKRDWNIVKLIYIFIAFAFHVQLLKLRNKRVICLSLIVSIISRKKKYSLADLVLTYFLYIFSMINLHYLCTFTVFAFHFEHSQFLLETRSLKFHFAIVWSMVEAYISYFVNPTGLIKLHVVQASVSFCTHYWNSFSSWQGVLICKAENAFSNVNARAIKSIRSLSGWQ